MIIVQENKDCILWRPCGNLKHTVCKNAELFNVKPGCKCSEKLNSIW